MKHLVPAVLAGCAFIQSSYAQDKTDLVAEEVVVTATRFEDKPGDQPVGVTVITGEEIRNSGESSIPRVLSRQAGIVIRDSTGSPDYQVDMRGFGATGDQNTLILVDGRRLSEYELTSARLSSIPVNSIERIEIVRSSGAVLYGGGATGGVVNIITRGPQPSSKSFDAFAGIGSYDTQDFRIGGQLATDIVGLDLRGARYSSDNYRDNNRVEQENFVADLRNFDPDRQLNLKLGYDRQDLRLPGNRTEAELQNDRRGTRNPDDFTNRHGGFGNLSGAFRISGAELVVDAGYREKKNDFHAVFAGVVSEARTEVDTWTLSPRVRVPFTTMGLANSLVVGADWEDWQYSSVRTNPTDASAEQQISGFYVQDVITVAMGTTVSLGGRLHRVEFDANDATAAPGTAEGGQARNLSAYEIGGRHEFGPALALYGKFGYSFRVATLDEVFAPGFGAFIAPSVTFLEPQTSHDSELGAEFSIAQGSYRVSVFRSELKDEIHFDPTTFSNVNLPPTQRSGATLEGRWNLGRAVKAFANYSYTDAKFRGGTIGGLDATGKRIPLVPRHLANAGVDWTIEDRTLLTAAANYVGKQLYDGDETNTFGREMPAYTTVDLGVFHDVGSWRFGASVRNLFDEKFYTYALTISPTDFVAYPAPERNFLVSAEYRFGP